MSTIAFIRKSVAVVLLSLAVMIVPYDENDDLGDIVLPWLEREKTRVNARLGKSGR